MVLHCSYWEIDQDMVVSTATHLLGVEGVGGGPALQLLGDRPGHGGEYSYSFIRGRGGRGWSCTAATGR